MKKLIILICILLFFIPVQWGYGESQELIKVKYLPLFEEIEQQAITELDSLINQAYIEYELKKAKGELTLPILFSYIEKGKQLEAEIDIAFQSLLFQMKSEFSQNGLSEELAKEYEQRYVKSKRKSKLQILKNITLEGNTLQFDKSN